MNASPAGTAPLAHLRPVAADELAEIATLLNRTYRGAGWNSEGELIGGQRADEAMLRDDLASSPGARLLVWRPEQEGPIRGCVWLADEGEQTWYLGSFAVDTELQSRGHGRALLDAAEREVARHDGARVRMLVVGRRDSLIAWYERRGYRRTGQTAPFPYGDERFGLPKRDDLEFVELMKTL
ncbi:hypothetical protein B2G71_15115 [Novosphingobium sp. PC22D]|uniref:GNAT family N-acetyltransferase n=1 Tax=Novosphingobium sp. PC22D TaxID=1962403 RepID=UPI000BF0D02A|nr:GNAT family N-acetyltransferase [Novosphingobium sp. PC22D]PEQ11777.1 hypothetical protein B2G71_15115 [Novosphingobium sp. PC22D]